MKGKVFDTEMVQAILKGDKTQFREPIKLDLSQLETDNNDKEYLYLEDEYGESHHLKEYSPYQVGDIIFVKETFKLTNPFGDFAKGNRTAEYMHKTGHAKGKRIPITREMEKNLGEWKQAVCMSQDAARIFLKIKNIKVQQIRATSGGDCKREGINLGYEITDQFSVSEYIDNFKKLWDSKYKKKGYGWNENPWTWCVEFEKVEKPIHQEMGTDKYFDELNKKLNNMSDTEFESLLIKSGVKKP